MGRIVEIQELILELGLEDAITDAERATVLSCLNRAESAVIKHLRYNPVYGEHTEYLPRCGGAFNAISDEIDLQGDQAVERQFVGYSGRELYLSHIPVRSIVSVHIDMAANAGTVTGAFSAATLKIEGVDFWPRYELLDGSDVKMCADGALLSNGLWPSTIGSVKVVYNAGYSPAELRGESNEVNAVPIVEAVLNEAVRRVHRRFARKKKTGVGFVAGNIVSENLGDYSYSVDSRSASLLLGDGDLMADTKDKLASFVRMEYY